MASIQARFDRSLVNEYRNTRVSPQRENRGFRSEDSQQSTEARRTRGRGRGRRDEVDPFAPVVTTQPVGNVPPPTSTSPATSPSTGTPTTTPTTAPATTTPSTSDGSVRSLAEKYVDTYAQQTGKSLSSATRDALVSDVASFYGENGSRTDRLRTLVGVF